MPLSVVVDSSSDDHHHDHWGSASPSLRQWEHPFHLDKVNFPRFSGYISVNIFSLYVTTFVSGWTVMSEVCSSEYDAILICSAWECNERVERLFFSSALWALKDYCRQFDALLNKVTICKKYVMSIFLPWLKLELHCSVKMFKPRTLQNAYSLAKLTNVALLTLPRSTFSVISSPCFAHSTSKIALLISVSRSSLLPCLHCLSEVGQQVLSLHDQGNCGSIFRWNIGEVHGRR